MYTVIGLHRHPAVLETIRIACERKGAYPRLPAKSRDALKKRIGFVTSLQIVIRNTRAQVVNMVKANVAGEPLENFRQLIE